MGENLVQSNAHICWRYLLLLFPKKKDHLPFGNGCYMLVFFQVFFLAHVSSFVTTHFSCSFSCSNLFVAKKLLCRCNLRRSPGRRCCVSIAFFSRRFKIKNTSLRVIPTVTLYWNIFVTISDILSALRSLDFIRIILSSASLLLVRGPAVTTVIYQAKLIQTDSRYAWFKTISDARASPDA